MANQEKKNNRSSGKKEDRLTLKPWLIGIASIAALCVLVAGIYFFFYRETDTSYISLEVISEGVLLDRENNITYYELSNSYEAKLRVVSDHSAEVDDGRKLYKLAVKENDKTVTLDTSKWLVESVEDGGSVFCSDLLLVPDILGFDTSKVYICTDNADEIAVAIGSLTYGDVDKFLGDYLLKEKYEGEGVYYEGYKIRLVSDKYTWLYYVLYLVRCDNGDYYVYGVEDRTGYTVSKELFTDIIGGDIDE